MLSRRCLFLLSSSCRNIRLLTNSITRDPVDCEKEKEEFCGPIPQEKVTITCIKGSGPGGQNVNKLNTKVLLKFNVEQADWLSERVKGRIQQLFRTRINKSGDFVLSSHKYRTQSQNITDALQKLEKFIKEASEVPKGPSQLTRDRIRILKMKSEQKRLRDKKYHSVRKTYRRLDD